MSASTSQRLPSRGSPSTDLSDDYGYDGGDQVLAAWLQGLAPDPDLTVSRWADRHRRLTSVASAEPGAWRTDRTPYLRSIMDDLSPSSAVERVVFMKGAQLGGTEAGLNWLGYVIHHAPGPLLLVQPADSEDCDLAFRLKAASRSDRRRPPDPVIATRARSPAD